MSARFSARETWVGLIVIVGIAGLIGLVGLASDGPGFLAPQKMIDIVFRDAQGLRVGSPVRVAGLDAGTVVDLDVVESKVDGMLRAKVRISLPANLARKLRQDVKVTVSPALTGMSHVNIVSSGQSKSPLADGQVVNGVETSLFDPIIEQLGLDAVARKDISHMVGEIRQTVDAAGPRLRQFLASLDETAGNIREVSESIRPTIESTVAQVEDLARRIRASTPRIEATLSNIEQITGQANGIVTENRENIRNTVTSVRDLAATTTDVVSKDRIKVERLLDGLDAIRLRSERVLYQADQVAGQLAGVLTHGRTEIERSITNVRDATDWASRLVQKLYANPFVLSPFYKPNKEDLRIEGAYSTALAFSKGAQELRDAARTLEALAGRTADPQQQKEVRELQQQVVSLTGQLNETSQRLAESLRTAGGRERVRR